MYKHFFGFRLCVHVLINEQTLSEKTAHLVHQKKKNSSLSIIFFRQKLPRADADVFIHV